MYKDISDIIMEQHLHYNGYKILDIHNAEDQSKIKWFIYYILEEQYEFISSETIENRRDEISDIINFYGSLILSLGYKLTDAIPYNKSYESVEMLLLGAGHLLKNREWKNTTYLTDENNFKRRILSGFNNIITVINNSGSQEEVLDALRAKVKVNKKRRETNY